MRRSTIRCSPSSAAASELLEETGLGGRLLHDHPALVDTIVGETPDGHPCTTFGVAYAFVTDGDATPIGEAAQPAAWWPIDEPPPRRAEHHWRRLTRHLEPP